MNSKQKTDSSVFLFKRIYKNYFQELFVYAKAIVKSDDLAKDAIEEVFVNLWESGINLEKIREIKSYLMVSVRNECFKLTYKASSFGDIADYENDLANIEKITPEEVLIEKELLEVINAAIKRLPDQCQIVFEMSRNQQMSYKEISRELGISTSAVGTQVTRAIKAIRTEIEHHFSEADQKPGIVGYSLLLFLFT